MKKLTIEEMYKVDKLLSDTTVWCRGRTKMIKWCGTCKKFPCQRITCDYHLMNDRVEQDCWEAKQK